MAQSILGQKHVMTDHSIFERGDINDYLTNCFYYHSFARLFIYQVSDVAHICLRILF